MSIHYNFIHGGKSTGEKSIPISPSNDIIVKRLKSYRTGEDNVYQYSQNICKPYDKLYHNNSGDTLLTKIYIPKGQQVDIVKNAADTDAIHTLIGPTSVLLTNKNVFSAESSFIRSGKVSQVIYERMYKDMEECHINLCIRLYKKPCFNDYKFSEKHEYIDVPQGKHVSKDMLSNFKSMIIPKNVIIKGSIVVNQDSIKDDVKKLTFSPKDMSGPIICSDIDGTIHYTQGPNLTIKNIEVKTADYKYDDEYVKDGTLFENMFNNEKTVFMIEGNVELDNDMYSTNRHMTGYYIMSEVLEGRFPGVTDTLKKMINWNEENDGNITVETWLELTDDYKYISRMCKNQDTLVSCKKAMTNYFNNPQKYPEPKSQRVSSVKHNRNTMEKLDNAFEIDTDDEDTDDEEPCADNIDSVKEWIDDFTHLTKTESDMFKSTNNKQLVEGWDGDSYFDKKDKKDNNTFKNIYTLLSDNIINIAIIIIGIVFLLSMYKYINKSK